MKDLSIIKKLVELLSNKNDTVLDCFMGSGTTGVACKLTDRNFIGIEKDDKYFDVANNRIFLGDDFAKVVTRPAERNYNNNVLW